MIVAIGLADIGVNMNDFGGGTSNDGSSLGAGNSLGAGKANGFAGTFDWTHASLHVINESNEKLLRGLMKELFFL